MSFHEDTKDLLCSAIDKEFEQACKEHGETYHSLHEGWAVLKEETEEVLTPIQYISGLVEKLWDAVKKNNEVFAFDLVCDIEMWSVQAMMELAQVYACCMKLQKTLEGGENDQ